MQKQRWANWLEEQKGPMFKIKWFRIILDEAQYVPLVEISDFLSCIKNPHVRASLACAELMAARKWCLTGTSALK